MQARTTTGRRRVMRRRTEAGADHPMRRRAHWSEDRGLNSFYHLPQGAGQHSALARHSGCHRTTDGCDAIYSDRLACPICVHPGHLAHSCCCSKRTSSPTSRRRGLLSRKSPIPNCVPRGRAPPFEPRQAQARSDSFSPAGHGMNGRELGRRAQGNPAQSSRAVHDGVLTECRRASRGLRMKVWS